MRIEFNGKPFDPDDFEDALVSAALEAVKEQIREKIGGIRDPETGEFPTVVIRATSLEDNIGEPQQPTHAKQGPKPEAGRRINAAPDVIG